MKLYTEEQVRMLDINCGNSTLDEVIGCLTPIELPSDSLCINCDESESTHNICMDCIIKIGKENIQLPSDEEIDTASLMISEDRKEFLMGAKYVINKIQGGNK